MSAGEPLRVAVIGAGDMGARHARHWAAAGARVVAVVDPDRPRAELAASETGAEAFSDATDALALGPEAVSVCTPTYLHAHYAILALEAGAHVLCEKPVALKLSDAYAMRDAAAAAGRELRIGFMRRFDPAFDQLLGVTARAGTPLLAQATITAGIRPKRLMHDAMANGGPIIDMCCHLFYVWDHVLGGQPVEASALGYTFSDGKPEVAHIRHRALDSALITLTYPNGSIGQVQVSWGLPSGVEPVERHTYVGPDGLVTVDWPSHVTLRDGRGVTRWRSAGSDAWRAEIFQFHAELTRGAEQRIASVEAGIDALKTSLAVLRSVAARRP
ncbi:MAG: Gfo/Idh/MocA family oxidoreductase, partial [Trueperaceae bacterium]|nr:Gfo/Idh/MocA family oxidoreductase [Trueperaceae bacterium]